MSRPVDIASRATQRRGRASPCRETRCRTVVGIANLWGEWGARSSPSRDTRDASPRSGRRLRTEPNASSQKTGSAPSETKATARRRARAGRRRDHSGGRNARNGSACAAEARHSAHRRALTELRASNGRAPGRLHHVPRSNRPSRCLHSSSARSRRARRSNRPSRSTRQCSTRAPERGRHEAAGPKDARRGTRPLEKTLEVLTPWSPPRADFGPVRSRSCRPPRVLDTRAAYATVQAPR